jgi:hypothetical protein
MRSIGELMKELGFNAESSEDSQKAFIKNLVKAAAEVAPAPTPIHVGAPTPKLSIEDLAKVPYVGSAKALAHKKSDTNNNSEKRVSSSAIFTKDKSPPTQLEFDLTATDDSKKVS